MIVSNEFECERESDTRPSSISPILIRETANRSLAFISSSSIPGATVLDLITSLLRYQATSHLQSNSWEHGSESSRELSPFASHRSPCTTFLVINEFQFSDTKKPAIPQFVSHRCRQPIKRALTVDAHGDVPEAGEFGAMV